MGATITLDGSLSTDPDNDTLNFRWKQTNELGDDIARDDLQDVFQPLAGLGQDTSTWQAVVPGTFFFRLLVDDNQFVSSATFSVEVMEAAVAGNQAEVPSDPPSTAGQPAGDSADQQAAPSANALCGGGMLSLGLVPLLLFPLRGRRRR